MNSREMTKFIMAVATIAGLGSCGSDARDPTAGVDSMPPANGTVSLEIPLAPPPTLDISIVVPSSLEGVKVTVVTVPEGHTADAAAPSTAGEPSTTEEIKPPECAVEATIEADTLGFEKNSWVISADGTALINAFVTSLLEANPGRLPERIESKGFASSDGGEEFNLQLSQHRSDAAAGVLASIPALVDVPMTSVGFGEASPIADNGTEEGRIQNRRVEMYFVFGGCA